MPLPLIPILLGGAALATAGYGVKKAIDAYDDSQTAETYHERAKKKFNEAQDRLDSQNAKAQKRFESLGQLQEQIVTDELQRYADIVDRLNLKDNADLQDIVGQETFDGLVNTQQSIVSLETALGGLTGGALAGALTGFGMYGGVGLLASASTGTAIASLSGVAATNATLAWRRKFSSWWAWYGWWHCGVRWYCSCTSDSSSRLCFCSKGRREKI